MQHIGQPTVESTFINFGLSKTADTEELIHKLTAVYSALEAAGAKPKGCKREYIANALGVSAATVGRYA